MNEIVIHKMKHNLQRTITSIKWVIFSMLVGLIVGLCGTAFYKGLYIVTQTRIEHPWLIFLLPFAGLLIVGLYHALKNLNDGGTNLVISQFIPGMNFHLEWHHLFLFQHLLPISLVVLPDVKVLLFKWEAVLVIHSENFSVLTKKINT